MRQICLFAKKVLEKMMDGLDEYHHDPMLWAVEVVIMQLEQMDANPRDQSSIIKVLNDGAYEFISACFEDEELKYPSEQNRNQKQPSLPQHYPIGLNNTGQIDNYSSSITCLSLLRLPVWMLKRPIICWGQRRISQNVISRFFTNHD